MDRLKKIDAEDLACLLAIVIGGVFAIVNPEQVDDAFQYTVLGILTVKMFW